MNEQEKREQLKRVPTRTLLASIKKDIRKALRVPKEPNKTKKK
jgi:hypothetical protein